MHVFKDNKGRSWEVVLDVRQVRRVRAALGIDLANVIALAKDGSVDVGVVDRIANDPCLLADVLWVLVEGKAKEDGVTDEEFGASLAGDSIEDAARAFLDELVDFFPGAKRLFLKKAVELSRKFAGETEEVLKKALADPELERMVAATSTSSSASSPGS